MWRKANTAAKTWGQDEHESTWAEKKDAKDPEKCRDLHGREIPLTMDLKVVHTFFKLNCVGERTWWPM